MSEAKALDRPSTLRLRLLPAVALVFLSPLIAEFMLGNVAIDGIIALPFLAPMYGGGALLIREFARRTSRSWPTMMVLGVAYSVWEEAIITQLLFNPFYHGLSLNGAVIPWLNISATQVINILTLHTVWSVGVSICLAELLVPNSRTTPWLGWFGLACTCILFLLGSAFICYSEYEESGFFANAWQITGGMVAVFVLVVAAFRLPRRLRPKSIGNAPQPWFVLLVTFAATSLFMSLLFEVLPGWPGVAAWAVLTVASVWLLIEWGRRPDWGNWHLLALVAGALLTYAWSSFPQQPVIGTPGFIDLVGNIVFAAVSMTLLLIAALNLRKSERLSETAEQNSETELPITGV